MLVNMVSVNMTYMMPLLPQASQVLEIWVLLYDPESAGRRVEVCRGGMPLKRGSQEKVDLQL